jgi:hypothetical protein
MVQLYRIVENVFIEFQDSSTMVDFMVVDMDPRQQTFIILGKPFLMSVRATIDKTKGTINMKVDGFMRSSYTTQGTLHVAARFESTDTQARGR